MEAPPDLGVRQAIRWGQILGLGGDDRLARAWIGTRLGVDFMGEEFWITLIRWFIENPMLDREHVGPIVDFLYHQRFQTQDLHVGPGRIQVLPPPHPNLSMRGRSPETLLAQVLAWHRKLSRSRSEHQLKWVPSGIQGLDFVEGTHNSHGRKRWLIQELMSSLELEEEGRRMRHCVASYASSCSRRITSIWMMFLEDSVEVSRCLTVQVELTQREIVQARGRANRMPSPREMAILERWAGSACLRISAQV